MAFRPLHDRVVVRRVEEATHSAGGIIIPDTAQEKPSEGYVVAVGIGARDEKGNLVPLAVAAGDTILFGQWSGNETKIDGEDLMIMRESDIMAIIDASKPAKAAPKAKAKAKAKTKAKAKAKSKAGAKKKTAAKKKK